MNRRQFLKTFLLGAAGVAVAGCGVKNDQDDVALCKNIEMSMEVNKHMKFKVETVDGEIHKYETDPILRYEYPTPITVDGEIK